jgi:hypothetical protein
MEMMENSKVSFEFDLNEFNNIRDEIESADYYGNETMEHLQSQLYDIQEQIQKEFA